MSKKKLTKRNKKIKPLVNKFGGDEPKTGWGKAQANAMENVKSDPAGAVGSVVSGLTGILGPALENAEVDTSKADNAIAAVESFEPKASSLDDLANAYNDVDFASTNWQGSDFSVSTGKALGNMGKAALSGAATGATFGPWGAVAGAAAGLIASGAGWAAGAAKAKEEAESKNREAEKANYLVQQKTLANKDNIMEDQKNEFMSGLKAYGGDMNLMGDYTNNLIFVDEGGTHEENPFEGVLMGYDNQGIPNLVEEGEIIWNDYVFSNRLKPYKKQLNNYGLNDKYKDWTFAKIVEDVQKASAEMPLDKIAMDSMNDKLALLETMQEEVRRRKHLNGENRLMAKGGHLFSGVSDWLPKNPKGMEGFNYYNNGQYDQGYLDYVAGLDSSNPVFQEAMKYYQQYKGTPEKDLIGTYAQDDAIRDAGVDETRGGIHDIFAKGYAQQQMNEGVAKIQDAANEKLIFEDYIPEFENEGDIGDIDITIPEVPGKQKGKFNWNTIGRLAPTLLNAGMAISAMAQKPDYSRADEVIKAARDIPMASAPVIGGKQTFRATDTNPIVNKQIGLSRATARDIQNNTTSGAQAMANLQNLAFNTQNTVGDVLLDAAKQDEAKRLQIADFNRGIDQVNAGLRMQAQQMNQARAEKIANTVGVANQMKDAIDAQRANAISSGLSNVAGDIGKYFKEREQRNWIINNPAYAEAVKANIVSKGGKLKKKRRMC